MGSRIDKGQRRDKGWCQLPPVDPITGLRLLHGNGCHVHDNCFTCPAKYRNNCHYDVSTDIKHRRKVNV